MGKVPLSKLLGDHDWLMGSCLNSDEVMLTKFKGKHGVEPGRVFRWGWFVYCGPEPEKTNV